MVGQGSSNTLDLTVEASTATGSVNVALSTSWQYDICEEFSTAITSPLCSNIPRKQSRQTSVHRILTSNEIILQKKRDLEKRKKIGNMKIIGEKQRKIKGKRLIRKGMGRVINL